MGDVSVEHWRRILLKEAVVGMLLGLVMGILGGAIGYFVDGSRIALIVGFTMASIIIFSNLFDTLLPFILLRLKLDPHSPAAL